MITEINVFQVESQYYLTQLHNTKTNTIKRLGSLASFNFLKNNKTQHLKKEATCLISKVLWKGGEKNPS